MQRDIETIARLERKVEAAREDFRLWIAAFVVVLPALTLAFGIVPQVSFVIVISAVFALILVVANRAWKDVRAGRAAKDQRQQQFAQTIPQPNDEQ